MCPHCHAPLTRVTDSRDKGGAQHRRRTCPTCGSRFVTFELTEAEYRRLANPPIRHVDKRKVADIIKALKDLVA